MIEIQNSKKYDLEERTYQFTKRCRILVKQLPKTIGNIEDGRQLIKASGSVHANYIEANESLSKKDYYHRVRVCRKEVKESRSWLRLLDLDDAPRIEPERKALIQEATELMRIFGSILENDRKY